MINVSTFKNVDEEDVLKVSGQSGCSGIVVAYFFRRRKAFAYIAAPVYCACQTGENLARSGPSRLGRAACSAEQPRSGRCFQRHNRAVRTLRFVLNFVCVAPLPLLSPFPRLVRVALLEKIPGVRYVPMVGKVTVAMLERNLLRLHENFGEGIQAF